MWCCMCIRVVSGYDCDSSWSTASGTKAGFDWDRRVGVVALLCMPGRLRLRLRLVARRLIFGLFGLRNLGGLTTELKTWRVQ
jgi:hypothetical protein